MYSTYLRPTVISLDFLLPKCKTVSLLYTLLLQMSLPLPLNLDPVCHESNPGFISYSSIQVCYVKMEGALARALCLRAWKLALDVWNRN